jgi:GDSL-like Lipase/Acylhydrolase family
LDSRRRWADVAVIACALLFWTAAFEIALRVVYRRSLDFSMEMWKYAVALKRPVADPNLGFVHAPNKSAFLMGVDVRINSQGLRDREYLLAKPAGVYRVLMLGDSTTLGWGVNADQTAAKVLERQLGPQFEVINTGVGNYGTVQEFTYYKTRGRLFHPDLVILQYFINDPEPVPGLKGGFLLDHSYVLAFTASRWDGLLRVLHLRPDWRKYYASLYDDNNAAFQAAQRALVGLSENVGADGSQLLVAILPELREINGDYPFDRETRKIKDMLDSQRTPFVDLIEGLRRHGPESSLWVTPLDPHPSAKAHSLIASQLLPLVRDRVRNTQPIPSRIVR